MTVHLGRLTFSFCSLRLWAGWFSPPWQVEKEGALAHLTILTLTDLKSRKQRQQAGKCIQEAGTCASEGERRRGKGMGGKGREEVGKGEEDGTK